MGTELMRICVKEDNDEFSSVPPGFESFSSFSLKRVEGNEKDDEKMITCSTSTSTEAHQSVKSETDYQGSKDVKNPRFLRRKHCINRRQFDRSSKEESDFEHHDQNLSSRLCLPKGVIRGSPAYNNCQKVVAHWQLENARQPNLEDAPVFFPTEEEFQDTLSFISSIRERAELYGICKIVPPPSWKPPCPLKERNIWEHSKFATRVQRIDKLQNRDSMKKISKTHNNTRKRRRCTRMGVDCGNTGASDVEKIEVENFGFEPGPEFTLGTFQRYADDFKARYFRKNENLSNTVDNEIELEGTWEPSVEDIEGEYWRMVERPTEEIEVLYGADLETGAYGSGFPRQSDELTSALDEKYLKSGWNLNNFPRLRGSVLSYESSEISGVLVPWLYIGMCFSSFCWHVEDHHLYSLNYMHWGAPKMWYGIPGKEASKLEEVMKKRLPDLFDEQPDLLHKLVTQLSPSILKSDGVSAYRCVQNPGEFVLTFPRAYHSGFNCGFNCAEAVNVAPVDWLSYGQIAIELYREQGRRTSISHDKLLLGAARDAVRAHWELNLLKKNTLDNLRWKDLCGKNGILAKALKSRVEMERVSRESLCSSSQALKMDSSFDANDERECSICLFDLHLSATGCHCCPNRYACLNHAQQFCSCTWDSKFFLFRYDINELNTLVDALEGKLSSVYRWARLDLESALTSYVAKDHMQFGTLSQSSKDIALKELRFNGSVLRPTVQKEVSLQYSSTSIKNHQRMHASKEIEEIPVKKPDESSGSQTKVLLGVKNEKAFLPSHSSSSVIPNHAQKEESASFSSHLRPVCQLSQEHTSYSLPSVVEEPESKKVPASGSDNVIRVSDDEDEKPKMPESVKKMAFTEKFAGPDNKDNSCKKEEKPILAAPVISAATMVENASISLHDEKLNSPLADPVKEEPHIGISQPVLSCNFGCTVAKLDNNNNVLTRESNCRMVNSDNCPQNALQSCYNKPSLEDRNENLGVCVNSNSVGTSINANASNSYNADRKHCQGLRIAKVIRRINCTVEPLDYGTVLSGKSWCNSQAIYPKGFRSRVRYTSALDPTKMCYYISAIVETRSSVPLFVVSVENCPSEVFVHVSATRCWDMVRERLNQEIAKQYRLGIVNLPPLLPPGSVDGFEMFGFSSPAIVQAIEAMDRNRVCIEYWDSRPYSRPQLHILPSSSQSVENSEDFHGNHPVLRRLFRKADEAELKSLYRFFSENKLPEFQRVIIRLLEEEIQNRGR